VSAAPLSPDTLDQQSNLPVPTRQVLGAVIAVRVALLNLTMRALDRSLSLVVRVGVGVLLALGTLTRLTIEAGFLALRPCRVLCRKEKPYSHSERNQQVPHIHLPERTSASPLREPGNIQQYSK
jgi:hypothetical protein